jgi:hypothetical protein
MGSQHPRLRRLLAWLAQGVLLWLLLAAVWWAGFYVGADTALCVVAVQIDGPTAVTAHPACTRADRARPWLPDLALDWLGRAA